MNEEIAIEESSAMAAWEDYAEMLEQEQKDRDIIDDICSDPYEDDSYYDGEYQYPAVVVPWAVEV
jgi:hypothetical protein